jgi:hypothetical protein
MLPRVNRSLSALLLQMTTLSFKQMNVRRATRLTHPKSMADGGWRKAPKSMADGEWRMADGL